MTDLSRGFRHIPYSRDALQLPSRFGLLQLQTRRPKEQRIAVQSASTGNRKADPGVGR